MSSSTTWQTFSQEATLYSSLCFWQWGQFPGQVLGGRSSSPRGEIVSLAVAHDIRGPFAYKWDPLDTPEWWEWGPYVWKGKKSNVTNTPLPTTQSKKYHTTNTVGVLFVVAESSIKFVLWNCLILGKIEQVALCPALIHEWNKSSGNWDAWEIQSLASTGNQKKKLPRKCRLQGIFRGLGQNLDFPWIWDGIQRISSGFKPQRIGYS